MRKYSPEFKIKIVKELLEDNIALRIENKRLKKGYMVKGAGASKEFVTTRDVNLKS